MQLKEMVKNIVKTHLILKNVCKNSNSNEKKVIQMDLRRKLHSIKDRDSIKSAPQK